MLRPVESPSRDLRSLNGIWAFRLDPLGKGRDEGWQRAALTDAREMPVPASYNDVVPEAACKDHVGDAWYQRLIRIPATWGGQRIVLRFDAACHRAVVWLDDHEVMRHEGGYTPFEADVTALVEPGAAHRLTVVVNNVLDWHSIPPGIMRKRADGTLSQQVFHDFFNYAGLHRSVWLYATPKAYVSDVTVVTDYDGKGGAVQCRVETQGKGAVTLRLRDADGVEVGSATGAEATIKLAKVTPWRPGKAYLYTLEIDFASDGARDLYTLPVGLRTVKVEGAKFLINGEPFYFTGFGKHEDSALRGKGHDDVFMVADFNIMKWMGANSFRTSHYPYAEEFLDYADRNGVVVIDETAAVGINMTVGAILSGARDLPEKLYAENCISSKTQATHLQAVRELIARDKNHPSVVLWSIANEPDLRPEGALDYFRPIVEEARRLDPTRPVTSVNVMYNNVDEDVLAPYLDVLTLNRYWGWYAFGGDLDTAEATLENELKGWASRYGKPMIMTEYGADTMPGQHAIVPAMWTEEYQSAMLAMYHRVHDRVPEMVGEHVWNFADFATSQGVMRVGGNRKGVFTRDRQPKSAAFVLRERWLRRDAMGRPIGRPEA